MSNDLEKTKAEVFDASNKIDKISSRIECLNFKHNNVTTDLDSVRLDKILFIR